MGDNVKRLMSGYIEELSTKRKTAGAPKSVTFSIRLKERDHARLVWLAERLETQKTPLAERMLRAAVDEAIEQYAEWASPEDPKGFVEEALSSIEDPRPGHGPPPGHERRPAGGSKKRFG